MLPSRRTLTLFAAVAVVASLRQSGEASAQAGACQDDASATNAPDMTYGAADAPLQLIVYVSATCPHCAHFHQSVWPQLKANYVDTGRVRFTFREMATAPAQVALAEFQLARCRCATPDDYLRRLDLLFSLQQEILEMGTMQGVVQALVLIGQHDGLSEPEIMSCIGDDAGVDRMTQSISEAQRRYGITGTPGFVLNGRRIEDPAAATYDGLARILDARLPRR
jgi:protein-disulfide isomerase